ncbi:MAG: hypothetical protein QXP53_01030 [Candidatus Pacearchaeota archaeon]
MKSLEQAENFLRIADHLAYVTYPLMKDGNLLKKILENLEASLKNILEIQEKNKMEEEIQKLKNIDEEYKNLLSRLTEMFEKRESSSFEFLRRNKLVFMDNDLKLSEINLEELKKYIQILKKILFDLKNR